MKNKYRKILCTGGAGFIGSSLCERLLEDTDNYIVIVDNLLTGCREKLPQKHKDRYKFITCDVNVYRDISELFRLYDFDYVFHYAAVVGVRRTQDNPVMVLRDIHGIENILNLCKNSSVKHIFFSSSSEIYGEPVELPQNEETTPLNSKLPYAIVKNTGEAFLRAYHNEFGINYTIFRFFNTYGHKQNPDFVVSKFIRLAIKNEPLTIYGDGMQSRTFCYINDNTEVSDKIFKRICENDNNIHKIINIGCDKEIHIIDLAKIIIELTNSKSEIIHLPPLKEGDMHRRQPDISKMKSIIQRDLISLEEGIKLILNDTRFII